MEIIIEKKEKDYLKNQLYAMKEPESVCCDEMKEALDENAIKLGDFEDCHTTDKSMNIFRCHPYPEGACWDSYEIMYCPFCGEKVELVEKKVLKQKVSQ